MKRIRQRPTVWRVMPRAAATSPLCPPSAQRKTIRARSAKAWAVVRRRASLSSSSRCSEVSTNAAFGLPNRIAALLVRRNGNASDIVLLFLGHDTSTPSSLMPAAVDVAEGAEPLAGLLVHREDFPARGHREPELQPRGITAGRREDVVEA